MQTRFLALGVVLFARDPGGCGGVDSPASGVNAPCTRDHDCRDELVCVEGVCAGRDAGAKDAADDG